MARSKRKAPKRKAPLSKAARQYLSAIGRKGARKGGKARMASLTKAERSKLAKKAIRARWSR